MVVDLVLHSCLHQAKVCLSLVEAVRHQVLAFVLLWFYQPLELVDIIRVEEVALLYLTVEGELDDLQLVQEATAKVGAVVLLYVVVVLLLLFLVHAVVQYLVDSLVVLFMKRLDRNLLVDVSRE